VPRKGRSHEDVSVEIADNARMLLAPEFPARKRVKGKVRAKGGKTLTAISTKAGPKKSAKAPAPAKRTAKAEAPSRSVKLSGKADASRR
jgi:hypothetical protein